MKSKKFPKKHWNDAFGWEMGEHIHAQIFSGNTVNQSGVEGECDGSSILIN
jgi:hypothetical protein